MMLFLRSHVIGGICHNEWLLVTLILTFMKQSSRRNSTMSIPPALSLCCNMKESGFPVGAVLLLWVGHFKHTVCSDPYTHTSDMSTRSADNARQNGILLVAL